MSNKSFDSLKCNDNMVEFIITPLHKSRNYVKQYSFVNVNNYLN